MKSVKLQITITISILLMFYATLSRSNQTLSEQEEASFFELAENETNKAMNLKNKRELSKIQSTLINVFKPVPVVDTIQPHEKYGNKGDKFDRIGRGVVNGVEAISNVISSALNIGVEHFNTVSALAAPRQVTELTYDELLALMENNLSPKRNKLVVQNQFLSMYQKEQQDITQYTTKLRGEVNDCEFNCESCGASIADVFLRAQLIRGIRDEKIRASLLELESESFDNIFKRAQLLEAAKVDSGEISKNTKSTPAPGSTTTPPEVHQVRFKKQNQKNARKPNKPTQAQYTPNKFRKKSKIDYKKLGIDGLCLRCGEKHNIDFCTVDRSTLKCGGCKKPGHVVKVCVTTLMKKRAEAHTIVPEYTMYALNTASEGDDRFFTHVSIENEPVLFEVDSGAKFTLLPKSEFDKLGLNVTLKPPDVRFRSYTQDTFTPLGKTIVNIKYKNKSVRDMLYVVPDQYPAILGRSWIRRLKIRLDEIDQENSIELSNGDAEAFNIETLDEDIKTRFADIFERRIGCMPNFVVSYQLRPGAKPVFNKERGVPYALLDMVDAELDALEKANIITKIETSDWGSPIVVVLKPDGSVRICVDYKVGVNERLVKSHYPIKKIEDIFKTLRDAKYYCKLDLYKAYQHVPVDKQSSIIQTITTHRGMYAMNRLGPGIKNAPPEFNRILEQILRETGAISFFDDILVFGKTKEECRESLIRCLEQLRKYDLHLNLDKCAFFATRVEYLGHVIEYNKIQKSEKKITAIQNLPQPKSVDDVRCFIGMAAHYSRFIPRFSERSAPLRKLMEKNAKFVWNKQCQASFNDLKQEIASDRVLTPYDPALPLQLACDASGHGLGAILSHTEGDTEKPIAYASRALTKAEKNYSQIDREALAIVFAVNHFYQYLFGRKFTLVTDNQPLVRIFNSKAAIPAMTAGRLQRYAVFLSEFDYEIKHRKGKFHENVDCLSRAPVHDIFRVVSEPDPVDAICAITLQAISSPEINYKTLKEETQKDPKLSAILKELQSTSKESNYSISGNILFKGTRVVVPAVMQPKVLEELHQTHLGICKMKQLARKYVFWDGIDKEIERTVRACKNCQDNQNSPPKAPLHSWQEPTHNWQRIHIDYAGPVDGQNLFVIMDAKSKWLEVASINVAPNSKISIQLLQDYFVTHGFPEVIVSDNATIFTSDEFSGFCAENGIRQKFIAPGHPATNSLGERGVQIIKRKLKEMEDERISLKEKIKKILFRYRITPLANGKTPSELYLGRQLRWKLDVLKPVVEDAKTQNHKSVRSLQVGDRVQSRYYTANKEEWRYGEIVEKLGQLHYKVKLDCGGFIKRHIDQLRSNQVKKPDSTVQPTVVPTQPATPIRPTRNRRTPSYLKDYSS